METLSYSSQGDGEVKAQIVADLTASHDLRALAAIALDAILLIGGSSLAIMMDAWWAKTVAAIIAGVAISTLFILGHDAGHASLFRSRRLNDVAHRFLFMPCLHNPTLWLYQHNYLHHQFTNVKSLNSFSPLSPDEYRRLTKSGRLLYRLYRHPAGFGPYYLIERWWKNKFYPYAAVPQSLGAAAIRDFRWLVIWLVAVVSFVTLSALLRGASPIADLVWGLVIPFITWNYLMGFTAFVQHTHPRAHWTRIRSKRSRKWQSEVTVHLRFPRWYDLLSHNIMRHPMHHESPRAPWYRLAQAERMDQGVVILELMSVRYVWTVARKCKLFDYERRTWVDFAGRCTS